MCESHLPIKFWRSSRVENASTIFLLSQLQPTQPQARSGWCSGRTCWILWINHKGRMANLGRLKNQQPSWVRWQEPSCLEANTTPRGPTRLSAFSRSFLQIPLPHWQARQELQGSFSTSPAGWRTWGERRPGRKHVCQQQAKARPPHGQAFLSSGNSGMSSCPAMAWRRGKVKMC